MQGLFCVIFSWAVFVTGVSFFCIARLGRYRRQERHMLEELSMLRQEDSNYRLSSCCRVGRMQEVIALLNQVVEKYRGELALLRRENRVYRESITSISHDIRTPLTSAKGYLQMLSKDALPDDIGTARYRSYIATVERRVDDVTDLLNQLFEYARVEAGEMDFHMERVNIAGIFLETLSIFFDDFVRKGCEPAVDVPQTPCHVHADRNALIRIMENLIRNALAHGTGDYHFSMRMDDSRVCLRVANRTDSIGPEDIDRIFDRFYTADTSRTRRTTGLGLAIVRQFAERMDAKVAASLESGVFAVTVVFQKQPAQ